MGTHNMKGCTYATYSMNAGEDIAGSALKWDIQNHSHLFERMIVVDGNLTDSARKYYSSFPNVEVIDSPWRDSHTLQYQAVRAQLREGEWCLYLDDDEVPSPELIAFCQTLPEQAKDSNINMFHVPDILYLTEDGTNFYKSLHDPLDYPNDGHIKRILFKAGPTLDFISSDGFHNVPTFLKTLPDGQVISDERAAYVQAPYFHLKSVESYIINDCVNAFKSPRNERFTEEEAEEFKAAIDADGISTMQQLRNDAAAGTWGQKLKDFAKKYRNEVDRPISRFYWWYFFIENPDMNIDSDLTWDTIMQYVLADVWYAEYQASKKNGEVLTAYTTPRKFIAAATDC